MADRIPPDVRFEFGGVNVSGNPINRPPGSACLIENLRVMPGNWLRLRSGRVARINATNALDVLAIHRVEINSTQGFGTHLVVLHYSGAVFKVCKLNLSPFSLSEAGLETLSTWASIGAWPIPMVNVGNQVVYYNGYGVRTGGSSQFSTPALSAWTSDDRIRFYGLHPVVSGTAPSLSFAAGAGNNTVATSVKIYAGLHNTETGHYSNGVLVGTQGPTGGSGTLTVNNVANIFAALHDANEQNETKIVFYATIDGFNVPYLIMNAALDGPHTVNYGSSSASLSVMSGTVNGWVLDLTHEMPTKNWPCRSVRSVCYANGRLYAILHPSASTSSSEYQISESDRGGVIWSEAEGSTRNRDFLGDPLQSWPPQNFKVIPTGERPIFLAASQDGVSVIVWTPSRTHILREQADGLHEIETLSQDHGLLEEGGQTPGPRTIATTRHGICWVTQRKQLAVLTNENEIKILSSEYDAVLRGMSITAAMYVYDPVNEIDRYHVFGTDPNDIGPGSPARSWAHDFRTGFYAAREASVVRFGGRVVDFSGKLYHLIAAASTSTGGTLGIGFYSIEGQPDNNYQIPTRDEMFTGESGQTKATQEISEGRWMSNWMSWGDPNWRKGVPFIDLIGDGAVSAQLSASPLRLEWFAGFAGAVAAGGGTLMTPVKPPQEPLDCGYRYKLGQRHHAWFKLLIRIMPHGQEYGSYYSSSAMEGDLASANFYGSVVAMLTTLEGHQNRG